MDNDHSVKSMGLFCAALNAENTYDEHRMHCCSTLLHVHTQRQQQRQQLLLAHETKTQQQQLRRTAAAAVIAKS